MAACYGSGWRSAGCQFVPLNCFASALAGITCIGEPIIKEGYVGKAKGMRQVVWERGWHKPASEGKMHGRKLEEDSEEDPTFSLPHMLSSCWDFAHEKTALQEYVESRGHILRMCVKGHPELAGVHSNITPCVKSRVTLD